MQDEGFGIAWVDGEKTNKKEQIESSMVLLSARSTAAADDRRCPKVSLPMMSRCS